MSYYITDDKGYRMRDSKDELFSEPTVEAIENVISYYFDSEYGDTFHVYDENDNLIETYRSQRSQDAEDDNAADLARATRALEASRQAEDEVYEQHKDFYNPYGLDTDDNWRA